MTKQLVERFTCDNPDCDDVAELPAPPPSLAVGPIPAPALPPGWIEFSIVGTDGTPGPQQPQMVHASRPECAAKMAEAQVAAATRAVEERAEAEEATRKKAEEALHPPPAEEPPEEQV